METAKIVADPEFRIGTRAVYTGGYVTCALAARHRQKSSHNTSSILCLLEGVWGWIGDSRVDRPPPAV
jgi:hypothetical protein